MASLGRAPLPFRSKATLLPRATTLRVSCTSAQGKPLQVVVTGAGGRTGKLVIERLLAQPELYAPRGVVRSEKSARLLQKLGARDDQMIVGDLLNGGTSLVERALQGADALIIATSAVPQIKPLSLISVLWAKVFKGEGPPPRPEFTFKANQMPEKIDWEGQRLQIDAAKKLGLRRVCVVGSMGGTQPDNFLNTIGNGNILAWKRKAEKYLMESGIEFTIVHPGGLIDEQGGQRELVLGVDDNFIKQDSPSRKVPRADVASFCVETLLLPEAANRAVDLVAREPGQGAPTSDFKALLQNFTLNCDYADLTGVEA